MSKKRNIITIGDTTQRVGKTAVSGRGAGVVASGDTKSGDTKSNGDTKNKTVAVRDFGVGSGYSGVVSWDGEKVTVGGTPIEPEYVMDGTAYVDRAAAEDAIDDMEKRSGIRGFDEVERMWDERYGGPTDDALGRVLDRGPFRYDPENDPVYDAYRSMYTREGEDALMRILNMNDTSVTGASGAVLSEALAARQEYLSRINDALPELAADAYERYEGESEYLLDALSAAADVGGDYYDRLYARDRDAYDALINAGRLERGERQRIAENTFDAEDAYYDHALDAIDIKKGDIDLEYYGDMANAALREAILGNTVTERDIRLADQDIRRGEVDLQYYRRMAEEALRAAVLENGLTAARTWSLYN